MEVNSVAISGGHNKIVQGASCYINEVTEDRKVVEAFRKYAKKLGLTCYVCNDDKGTNQSENLLYIVGNHNKKKRDLDISIHFNAYKKVGKDGKSKGVEVWVYDEKSECYDLAKEICDSIARLGFTNRGVKVIKSLAFLKNTKKPSMLIEVCFVDDKDDTDLYNKIGADTIGKVIAETIARKEVPKNSKPSETVSKPSETPTFKIPKLKGYRGFSVVDGLKKFGYKSDKKYRGEIWVALGYKAKYKGTAQQNLRLLNALKRRG